MLDYRNRYLILSFALALWLLQPALSFPLSNPNDLPEEIKVQEALFNLPLGYRLTAGVLDLYNQTARSTDYALLEPLDYNLVSQINRGRIICLLESGSFYFSLPPEALARCEFLCLGNQMTLGDVQNLRILAELYRKKTAVAPEGSLALADNAQWTSQLAPYAHLFIIQAGQWLEEDASPTLDTFLSNVHAVATAARTANPNILLQVQVGCPSLSGGLTVEKLYSGLSRLVEVYPDDLKSYFIFRSDAWNDPQRGNNTLLQTLTFLRRKAYSNPGAPDTPHNLQATVVSPTEVCLTWEDISSNETGFLLKREKSPGHPPTPVNGLPAAPDIITFHDTLLEEGPYYYRICAYNSNGISLFSPLEAVDTRGGKVNFPPQVEPLSPPAAFRGVPFEYKISATDPDSDPLTYSLSLSPSRMIIDSNTGLIYWLPSAVGRYFVSITVTDGQAADFLWLELVIREGSF